MSLILIGGVFGLAIFGILSALGDKLAGFYDKIAEIFADPASESWINKILQDPKSMPIVLAVIGGVIIWSVVHSTFVKPFVLVGVLRNYIESGKDDVPTEESFRALDSKSPKFRKLHSEI